MSSPQMMLELWILQAITQAATTVILYHRKLRKEFPAFFLYMVVQLVTFCVQFPVYKYADGVTYYKVYWVATALDLFISFKIIHEIFMEVFKPYHALKDLGTALFKWAALVMVLLSAVLISINASWQDPLLTSIFTVQRCVRVVQCGLVVFLFAFSRSLQVSWRRLSFGIALGFGVVAGGELLSNALFSGQRLQTPLWQISTMVTYELGMCIWLFYSLTSRRRDMVPVLVPQRWDEALMEIQPGEAEGDSLIPMFEHMVDQALSKTNSAHS